MTAAHYDGVEAALLFEIRQLALDMIRMEDWARDAAERRRFDRVAELCWQRELAMERRSWLMREMWAARIVNVTTPLDHGSLGWSGA
jgi:hypothetical protein